MRRVCPRRMPDGRDAVAIRRRAAGVTLPSGRLTAVDDGDGPDGPVALDLVHGAMQQSLRLLGRFWRPRPQGLAQPGAGGSDVGGHEGADPPAPLTEGKFDLLPGDPLQP